MQGCNSCLLVMAIDCNSLHHLKRHLIFRLQLCSGLQKMWISNIHLSCCAIIKHYCSVVDSIKNKMELLSLSLLNKLALYVACRLFNNDKGKVFDGWKELLLFEIKEVDRRVSAFLCSMLLCMYFLCHVFICLCLVLEFACVCWMHTYMWE